MNISERGKQMCRLCGKVYGCYPRCPNYSSSSHITCCYCEEKIEQNEEYLENEYGEYRHIDCFSSVYELLKWLGYDIKYAGSRYEEN